MEPGLVVTILVNWNGWRDTAACVESCEKLDYAPNRLLVVDNGSTDDSVARLRERFPDLRIVETGVNLGFAGGNNAGIRAAVADGAEFVWLLNNDTTVDPGALSALVAACRADARVGMAGSKILYMDRPGTLWYAGGFLAPWAGWTFHRGEGERDAGQHDRPGLVDFVTGCSLLARTALVERTGPLREEFFLYGEDFEWSARARRDGWRLEYVPASRVWHKLAASTAASDGTRNWRYEGRNRMLAWRTLAPARLPWYALAACAQAAWLAIARGRFRAAAALLRGVADGLAGRSGRIA